MTARHQMSVTREQVKFFLGLGLMIAFFYVSMLRQQQIVGYEYAILVSVTLAMLVFDYLKVSQFLAVTKENEEVHGSHDVAIQAALKEVLKSPLLVKLLRTELLTLYYAFFAKFERSGVVCEHMQFSYARSSNAHDVFLFVALSQLPFLPFIHAFLEYKKGPGIAWVITLVTLWSVIWFLAQVEAAKFRPIEVSDEHLKYRYGLSWEAEVPLSKIKLARCIAAAESFNGDDLFMGPIGSTRNVLLEFDTPIQFRGPYLQKRSERKAAISLDNPSGFLSQLEARGIATDPKRANTGRTK
ncbi:MAG: hypothetical protein K0U72_03125 [Gammaproteobacteria bacterium]|nr:hypothetical protein [Gammaproteobacteria bacterium]